MSELVPLTAGSVIDPVNGEILDLAVVSEKRLGELLLDVRHLESRLRELKQLVSLEVHQRMDRERSWTLETGGLKLTGQSDAPKVEWDVNGLVTELDQMVDEGVLTREGRDRAVQARVEWKVLANGIRALLKSPVFRERLEPYRMETAPENRRVSVSVA